MVVAGRLLRCAPEQLRAATPSEEAARAVTEGAPPLPDGWTFGDVLLRARNAEYSDIRRTGPPDEPDADRCTHACAPPK